MSANAYDTVQYPSAVYQQTHPDRLAVIAALHGLNSPPVENCRVLELGCGDGWNLIAMAHGLPDSEFVGIDLAAQPVARGTMLAQELALRNLSLQQRDVAEAHDLGKFDYIIAHGLFSWVPAAVRHRILEICGQSLTPRGVAYISYNAYPGNHARDLVRGMIRYHTAHFDDPQQKVRQARGLVKFLAESKEPKEAYHQLLSQELERIEKYTDGGVFHDDLGSINQPFYFHEFMAQAMPHGLQFLAEADMADNMPRRYAPKVEAVLAEIDPRDAIGQEQYADFLRFRAFRQTLLCRAGLPIHRRAPAECAFGLRVAGDVRPARQLDDPSSSTAEIFHGRGHSEIETDRPLVKAAFTRLAARWPACFSFDELLTEVLTAINSHGFAERSEAALPLAAALIQAYESGIVEFRAHRPPLVAELSERPRASSLARLQLQFGDRVTSLLHTIVQIQDPLGRALVNMLDGSRDRAALQAELARLPAAQTNPVSEEVLEQSLRGLARNALLIG